MNNRLSLINYILKKYNKDDDVIKGVIDFILDYNNKQSLIRGLEVDGEYNDLSNYILLYLNDQMTDEDIYKLCLDSSIYVSNYSKVLERMNENTVFKPKILINM